MRTVKILFLCHIFALTFGLAGLLIALPHPELWQNSASLQDVFTFGIRYAGSLHILFGAATMLLFGLFFVGVKKTLIFFAVSTLTSLSMELLGTSTGFPFGPYAYTDFLGYKILNHVPFSIPLSWFYMGFTAYLLANLLVAKLRLRRRTLWSLLLGAALLTVWDLSLDPSMASPRLSIHFWIWYESGPYFGMPVRNLVGWALTGLVYMSISRLFWRENLDVKRIAAWLPFGMYTANTCFAIALALAAGIWQPLLIAIGLGLLPAALVLWSDSSRPGHSPGGRLIQSLSHLTIRRTSALLSRRHVTYRVEGREHLPQDGSVLIVARHFHHFYDGCILLNTVRRPLHILVGLDWISRPALRWLMEGVCAQAEWPVILREEGLQNAQSGTQSVYRANEIVPYLRQAVRLTLKLLRQGEVLAIFPEAYPAVDPHATLKTNEKDALPFRSGFARLVELAERDKRTHVTIVPAGLAYVSDGPHWHATLRFGPPRFLANFPDAAALQHAIEEDVRALSIPIARKSSAALTQGQEALSYGTNSI
ncbi:MAG TPA: carotenoid biosynthesis protein [Ktedonobacteraceae bacterium]